MPTKLVRSPSSRWRSFWSSHPGRRWLALVGGSLAAAAVWFWLAGVGAEAEGPLRMGYQQSPPYQEIGPDGSIGGLAVEIVREAARRLDIELEWVYAPRSPDEHFAADEVDLWPVVTRLARREGQFHISKPVYQNSLGLLYLQGRDIGVEGSMEGKRLAYYDREPARALATELCPKALLAPTPSHVEAIDAVFRGEADAALLWSTKRNSIDFKQAVEAYPDQPFSFYYYQKRTLSVGVGANLRRRAAVVAADRIREEIRDMVKDGTVQEIYFKVYLDPENEISSYFYLDDARRRAFALAVAIGVLVVATLLLALLALKLRRSRQAAYAASEAKSAFLANMSHEFRTPLNGIMGMTQLAQLTESDEERRGFLKIVMQSSESLLRIVEDILDLSKVEAGRLELEPTAFSVQDLLNATTPVFELSARQKGVELSASVAPGCPPYVMGDMVRIRQVLFNLVGNAVKFTPSGFVHLKVNRMALTDGDWLLFEVSDTGIGIPEDRFEHIFEAFSQVDVSSTRDYGGTGLGLSISRNLVELMGGELRVESVLGRGSVFSFNIPYKPVGESAVAEPLMVTEQPGATALPSLTLLVVDDNEVNLSTARSILVRMGHSVKLARDGVEALQYLEERSVDMVLMDIQMPNMDGWDATRAIRRLDAKRGKRTPVLALTAASLTNEALERLRGEMDGCIAKPIEFSAMRDEILQVARAYSLI